MQKDVLGAPDGGGVLVRHGLGGLHRAARQVPVVAKGAGDESEALGLRPVKDAGREGEVHGRPRADDGGEPLEGAEVRREADVDLLDAEAGVRGGEPEVARGDEVDAGAPAAPVDGGDHGDGAPLEAGHAVLHHENELPELEGVLELVPVETHDGSKHAEIDAGAKVLSQASQDDHVDVPLELRDDLGELAPHAQVLFVCCVFWGCGGGREGV